MATMEAAESMRKKGEVSKVMGSARGLKGAELELEKGVRMDDL
jgi:hypothetical protein